MSKQHSPSIIVSIDIVKPLINALNEVTQDSDVSPTEPYSKESQFSSGKIPKISLDDYFKRIIKYCKLEYGTFIGLMIYLDKIAEKIEINSYNIHRLILAALVCSYKYTLDYYVSNQFFAKVGGISNTELAMIEASFLEIIDYKLYISQEEYEKYQHFIR